MPYTACDSTRYISDSHKRSNRAHFRAREKLPKDNQSRARTPEQAHLSRSNSIYRCRRDNVTFVKLNYKSLVVVKALIYSKF